MLKRIIIFISVAVMTVLSGFQAFCLESGDLSAVSAVLYYPEYETVLFGKNPTSQLSMASTTKIMTSLIALEECTPDRVVEITAEMVNVEGSSSGLSAGDKITLRDLVYCMMLESGNDAANSVAIALGGSFEGFAEMMNKRAAEIGMKNTSFVTPSGLDDENHYTTAYDLAMLTKYAMNNKDFAAAVGSKSAVLNYGNPPYRRTLTNHNKLLKSVDGCVGVKTGFTKKSGRCLVSAVKRDGKYVIAVTLNAPNDWQDHKNMLEYGLSKIIQTEVTPKKSEYVIPVISGENKELTVKIEPLLLNSLESENISCEVYLPPQLFAPVKKGEVIGKTVYKQNGKILLEQEIFSNSEIKLYKPKKKNFKNIFNYFLYIVQFVLGD